MSRASIGNLYSRALISFLGSYTEVLWLIYVRSSSFLFFENQHEIFLSFLSLHRTCPFIGW